MISLITSGAVALVAIKNFQYSLCLFVFFLAFTPRSLGLSFGANHGSLTFSRLSVVLLLILAVIGILARGSLRYGPAFKLFSTSIGLILTLSSLKILSSVINGNSIVYAVDDALRSSAVFLLFLVGSDTKLLSRISKYVLVAFSISMVIASLEYQLGGPLHASAVNDSVLSNPLSAQERGGRLRVQALFDGPLFFAEFIVLSFSVYLYQRPKMFRLVALILLACFVFLIFANGSRSLLLAVALTYAVWCLLPLWKSSRFAGKYFLSVAALCVSAPIIYFIISKIESLGGTNPIGLFHTFDPLERSSVARAFQFFEVSSVLAKSPLLGIGVSQNYVSDGVVHTIDNYYLRVALESGILGLITLFLFFASLMVQLLRIYSRSRSAELSRLAAFLIVFSIGFVSFRFFFQDPSGLAFYFALLGTGLSSIASHLKLEDNAKQKP